MKPHGSGLPSTPAPWEGIVVNVGVTGRGIAIDADTMGRRALLVPLARGENPVDAGAKNIKCGETFLLILQLI